MHIDEFDFHLPQDRIATRPISPRDAAKLLVCPPEPPITDAQVRDLPEILREGDLLVFNNTRVIPAYLQGTCDGKSVEFNLHKQVADDPVEYLALCKPARKVHVGPKVQFAKDFAAEVVSKEGGEVRLRFAMPAQDFAEKLANHGHMPLPPYIQKLRPVDEQDMEDYQTTFAEVEGSVAAPTASLHYTPELIARLKEAGIDHCFVTLHVGAGTFLPVKVENIEDHKMHSEYGIIPTQVAERINQTKANGGRVLAVGTTSLRLLESATRKDGTVAPFTGETDIFITPGYRFRAIDALLTNFHLPKSTLFMLVSALIGLERAKEVYAHALEHDYRFFSYGDTSLLWKHS